MPRSLSDKSTLALLKQEARRWFQAVKAGDAAAHDRLRAAWPAVPGTPSLRDVQHALAREYGCADWIALRAALDALAFERQSRDERLEIILRHGWGGDRALAQRIVARWPELAEASIFAAATCGNEAGVARWLARDPDAARQAGGPLNWSALTYVCYGRLDATNAVAIATRLLDAGADPRVSFDDGWGNPFTCITGAVGLGEGVKPPHPQANALVRLLLARGADPFDTQTLYNDSIAHDDPTWMAMLWEACARAGRTAEWSAREGRSLGGRIKTGTLNYLLGNAVTNRHHRRAAWLLDHGADARTPHAYAGHAVHTVARLNGDRAMMALLESRGATPDDLDPSLRLEACLMAGDADAARTVLAEAPQAMSLGLLGRLAGHGQADAVAWVLDRGGDPDALNADGATALHRATHAGSMAVIDLLLARGASIDVPDRRWQSTALGWAVALGRHHAAERLARDSRDVFALASSGRVARLAAVLRGAPALARVVRRREDVPTPLFALPDDDEAATEVAALLIAAGADRRARDGKGRTPAEAARARGLDDAADVLGMPSAIGP